MKRVKKILRKTFLVFLILLPVAGFAHYLIFPQETNCILISFSGLKKSGPIYFDSKTPQHTIDTLQTLIQLASARNAGFWGEEKGTPKFIYCNTDELFKKYGNDNLDPATTHFKWGAYVVIGNAGVDLDIIAHELTHAELGKRIGFFNLTFKIPLWFNEGLAMQNDYRKEFAEDSLSIKTGNYKNIPNVKDFTTAAQFYGNNVEELMLHYRVAKHEIKSWYSKEKLEQFIKAINAGKGFSAAYGK